MFNQEETLCELWDEGQIPTQAHSRLYHLEPIGLGSPMVESLTSYITRLAEAHSVYPYNLFRKEICPLLVPQQTGNQFHTYLTNRWRNSSVLNGLSSTTNQIVQMLEHLTLHHKLSCLTMLSWKHAFSSRRLVKRQKAWCPACYEEWRSTGQIIYEPLFWSLECVTTCLKHATILHTHCPFPDCSSTIFALHQQALSGFCPRCHRWLGAEIGSEASLQGENWKEQQRTNNQIGELLSAAYTLPPLPQDMFVRALHICVEAVAGGNILTFARHLDLEHAAVWRWQQQGFLPQLNILLWICSRLEISPLQFLTGNLSEILVGQSLDLIHASPRPDKRITGAKRVDYEKVNQILEACLDEQPPPSLREMCRRTGHKDKTLYAHFAEFSHAIAERYRTYQAEQSAKRIQRECDAVREAIQRLCDQGRYPGERAVRKILGSNWALRDKVIEEVWENTLQERGLA